MKRTLIAVSILLALALGGCVGPRPSASITQHSTIDALLAGVYDGDMPCRELMRHGNLGIGTFNRLDGEMILIDGQMHQVKADGKVYSPDPALTTPFAAVTEFQPDMVIPIQKIHSQANLLALLDELVPNQNVFCAVKLTGHFTEVRTRSVPAQNKPYPPLASITPKQPEFRKTNMTGTLVGFRCPPFVKGLNVPGYHLHFLSAANDFGGHVLNFELLSGQLQIQICRRFVLLLPEADTGLAGVDFSKDRSDELKKVEQ